MREVLVFGGTTEGRELASWLAGRGRVHVTYLAATELGQALADARVEALAGPLDDDGMHRLVEGRDVAVIVDATHPYAIRVTKSAAALGEALGIEVIRVRRASVELPADAHVFADAASCARALDATQGNVLLTSGTNDLSIYCTHVRDFEQRLYARILPTISSLERALVAGLDPSHLLCIQGASSAGFNLACIHEFSARHLVTKESGALGGFPEKVEAARIANVELWVIKRPDDAGVSYEEAQRLLEVHHGC